MQSTPATQTPQRRAPLALWRIAEKFLHILHALFGAPEDLARAHTLTRKSHALIASWLRCGEALMRRLLLIEAAALIQPPRHPTHPRRTRSSDKAKPQAPRISFRIGAERTTRESAERRAFPARADHDRRRLCSALPLAQRYAALIAVANDPLATARRLARRLHANPRLIAAVLRAPPEARHRIDGFAALTDAARTAGGNSMRAAQAPPGPSGYG